MNILNLPGWEVTGHSETGSDYRIEAAYTVAPANCPHCAGLFDKLYRHGVREQHLRDLPAHGKRVTIALARKRYRCQDCGKTFLQPLPDVDERSQMTRRLADWVGEQSIGRTFVSVAGEVGLDEKTVRNLFNAYVERLDAETVFETPEYMGIDEVHLLGRPRCVFTNVKERTLIGVLEKRDKKTVTEYLRNLHCDFSVKVVTMDMWRPYLDAVRATLPNAAVVVDKFHVVRMATAAMEVIRKAQRAGLEPKVRRRLMHDRFILLRRPKDLEDEQRVTMAGWFEMFPKLAEAYRLKEAFYDLWTITKKEEAVDTYREWERSITDRELLTAFQPLLTAMHNWREEVFAYWDHRITNACTEALNGIAKLIERNGRGYSFKAMRAKMLFSKALQKQPTPKPRRSPAGGGTFAGSPAEGPIPTLGTDLDALLKELQQESGRPSGSNSRRR